jgi:hypothetical protein
MRRSWTPSIVPNGQDQIFYLVINNYGNFGPAFAETDLGEAIALRVAFHAAQYPQMEYVS